MDPHRLVAVLSVAVVIAACDGGNPSSPVPLTPPPSGSTALAPQTMVVRPDQLRGYTRSEDATVTADSLASQAADPSLRATLKSEGLVTGARVTFVPPQGGNLAFAQLVSQALVFGDAAGATRFTGEELGRRQVAPQGGSIAPLTGLPQVGVDQVLGLDATLPADTSGSAPPKAYFVSGVGDASTATLPAFTALVSIQEALIAGAPTV